MTQDVAAIGIKVDTDGVERGIKSLEQLVGVGPKVEQSMNRVGAGSRRAGQDLKNLGAAEAAKGLERTALAGNAATASLGSLRGALASLSAVVLAKNFIGTADAVTTLNNQLRLATGSTASAAAAYSSLYQIAQRSRVGFVELGQTFASIARAAEPLGISQERLLTVTESIGNAMTISGGSAQGLQAALIQLSQGLASGTLRGEELNSVMEQAPRLAKALADGMGVTIGQLRTLGAEGAITSAAVIKALESQAQTLQGEVAGATLTVGQAFTQLGNATTNAVGEFDRVTGASSSAASAISSVASAIDSIGRIASENESAVKAVLGFTGVVVGAKAASVAIGGVAAAMTAARMATVGFTAALAANPIGAAIVAITALGAAAYASGISLGEFAGAVDDLGAAAARAEKETAKLSEKIKQAEEDAQAAASKLAKAEEALARLEARGAKGSPNLMLREAYKDAERLVDKLREAKRERDSLLESVRSMRVEGDPYNSMPQYKELKQFDEDRVKARARLREIDDRKLGINKQFLDELSAYHEGLRTGELTLDSYTKKVIDLENRRADSVKKRGGSGGGNPNRDTQALARFEISAVQAAMSQITAVYTGSEAIIESLHRAGLVDERDYYEAKIGFVEMHLDAKRRELEEENRILAAQSLKGVDAIERDRKIAENRAQLAKITDEAAFQTSVLAIESASAAAAQQASFKAAERSAKDYLDTLRRGFQRDAASVGMGDQERSIQSGKQQVEDQYAARMQDIYAQREQAEILSGGKLSAEMERRFAERLTLEKHYLSDALIAYDEGVAARLASESRWENGATRAWKNYAANAANVAEHTANLFTKAFQGMEDAIVNFAMTGKLSFSDMAKSIIADLIRIQARQAIVGMAGSLFGQDGPLAAAGKFLGFASGGYTGDGGKYEPAGIVHKGEYVINAASTKKLGLAYLSRLNGYANGGLVGGSALPAVAGGGDVHISVTVDAGGQVQSQASGINESAMNQLGKLIGVAVKEQIVKEKRPGGILYAGGR